MATLKTELWNILRDVGARDFRTFQWILKEPPDGIPLAQLEGTDREGTVDLMVQKYQSEALRVSMDIFQKIGRMDLVRRLQGFTPEPADLQANHFSAQREECFGKRAALESIRQFAAEVTLDPDTANPSLVLSADGKQVYEGDVRKDLPELPVRFDRCANVLGKQSISRGRFYFEVQVKGKTDWVLGLAKESVNRKGKILLCPDRGFWTMWLMNGEYMANDNVPLRLSLNKHLQKVGVFVDYGAGLVSFYDADTADPVFHFTDCSFREKLYPFFSPCSNNADRNRAPLIICHLRERPSKSIVQTERHESRNAELVSTTSKDYTQMEELERRKADLRSIQRFEVEVTLDADKAHPALVLSDDRKQVHHGNVLEKLHRNPDKFSEGVNVLAKQGFLSRSFYYEVQVQGKTAWTLGVAKESIDWKKDIRCPENGHWTIGLRNAEEYVANDTDQVKLSLGQRLQRVGVFVNYEEALVSFYDVDAADLIYCFVDCSFREKLYPYFSPFTRDGGINSAPLVISPVSRTAEVRAPDALHSNMAELRSVQQFGVVVSLDADTAHPNLLVSDDEKQVSHGDVRMELADNPGRFATCAHVLGKPSISSGKFYFEVQVEGKPWWTVGVAKESIDRKGEPTLCPEEGFWTIRCTNANEHTALNRPIAPLFLKSRPQKVGVFTNYDEGLVSFYDADTADLLYCFADCSFAERVYPFFSPGHNDNGRNAPPLTIWPVSHALNVTLEGCGRPHTSHRKRAELQSLQRFAVDVTLDPDTAHPSLVLSDDGKRAYDGDESKDLPQLPGRFDTCVNVLAKQRFSSGKFYFEVQVTGKTAWTIGVASASINRKGNIRLSPDSGFWTIWLRNGDEYEAIDQPSVPLRLSTPPQKVGVFVDYEDGLVCFYDVDEADLLYAFTDCSFSEELLPYLSPCTNDHGTNTRPLILTDVNHFQ